MKGARVLKPILFNTPMVQAILEGGKTSTRRIIKRTPSNDAPSGYGFWKEYNKRDDTWYIKDYTHSCVWWPLKEYIQRFSKYKVGDILYVRETWRKQTIDKAGHIEIQYKTDFNEEELACYGRRGGYAPCKWHSPSCMPKEAARIFLKVTDIKVERLQNITEREALKEGIRRYHFNLNMPDAYGDALYTDHKLAFKQLWNSTVNKKNIDKYGWDADPYIWTIEFQRVEKEG